jgi:hypothetical protein
VVLEPPVGLFGLFGGIDTLPQVPGPALSDEEAATGRLLVEISPLSPLERALWPRYHVSSFVPSRVRWCLVCVYVLCRNKSLRMERWQDDGAEEGRNVEIMSIASVSCALGELKQLQKSSSCLPVQLPSSSCLRDAAAVLRHCRQGQRDPPPGLSVGTPQLDSPADWKRL